VLLDLRPAAARAILASKSVAADIGNKLRALKPDLWIIFSNEAATKSTISARSGPSTTGMLSTRRLSVRLKTRRQGQHNLQSQPVRNEH
jgi:sarcosine oxidase gamma subunit